MTLKIVTDSTSDLPPGMADKLDVTVVPCNVHFGTETYRDGLDISRDAFYRRLVQDERHPTTSQPSVGTLVETYQKLAPDADEILSLHVSSKLSVTYSSAVQAAKELINGPRVDAYDSLTVSLGLGILVREVARIAQEGGSLNDATTWLAQNRDRVETYFSVSTLKYLARGGRASRLQSFFGGVLDIKPILQLRDGEAHPFDRVRSRKRLLQRFEEIAASKGSDVSLGLIYSVDRTDVEALAESCAKRVPGDHIMISEFSPVMGTHLGPKALGLAILPGGA